MHHTRESIKALLATRDDAVERAIVAIYKRQTASEQASHETIEHNGRGFASCHARYGTYYAKWIQGGKRLSGAHLERARKMTQRYIRQLLEIAGEGAPKVATPPFQAPVAPPAPQRGDWA